MYKIYLRKWKLYSINTWIPKTQKDISFITFINDNMLNLEIFSDKNIFYYLNNKKEHMFEINFDDKNTILYYKKIYFLFFIEFFNNIKKPHKYTYVYVDHEFINGRDYEIDFFIKELFKIIYPIKKGTNIMYSESFNN